MSNPLKNMMPQQAAQGGGGNPLFSQIRQFAGMIGNRNPKKMAMNLAKQRGIGDAQMQQLMQEAQQIARQMGMTE